LYASSPNLLCTHEPEVTFGTWVMASEEQWTQMIGAMGSDGLRPGADRRSDGFAIRLP